MSVFSKLSPPNFAKRSWTVDRANNLPYKSRGYPSQKIGPKTSVFDDFET